MKTEVDYTQLVTEFQHASGISRDELIRLLEALIRISSCSPLSVQQQIELLERLASELMTARILEFDAKLVYD